jgi:putative tricarboxylic transport membrane protein
MRTIARLCCALALVLAAAGAHAQAPAGWKPSRTAEIVSPAAPGGSVDAMSRAIKRFAEENKLIDVPFNVLYKTGAAGSIGLEYMAQNQGRGEVLFASSHTFLTIRETGDSKYDYRDLAPVGLLFKEYHVIAVKPDGPVRDGRDLIDKLRRDPSSVSFGFFGNPGNHLHLAAAIPLKAAGVDIRKLTTVQYRSGPEALTAVMGGHLDAALVTLSVAQALAEAGKLKVITQTAPTRRGGYLAGVPTWKELGVNVEYATAQGVLGAKGMSGEQIAYWEGVLAKLSRDEEWRKLLSRSHWEPSYMTSAEMKRYYDEEHAKLKAILAELGLTK